MKIIETKLHGYMNYTLGFLFLIIPSILNLGTNKIESLIFYMVGIFTIFFSLLADYELGLYKVLSFKAHLFIDVLLGLCIAVSPWIFNFHHSVFMPHLSLGLIKISIGLLTRSEKSRSWRSNS